MYITDVTDSARARAHRRNALCKFSRDMSRHFYDHLALGSHAASPLTPPASSASHSSTRLTSFFKLRYIQDILLEKGTYLNIRLINLAEVQSHFSLWRLDFQYRKDTLCIELQNFSFLMVKSNITFGLMSVSTEMRAVRGLITIMQMRVIQHPAHADHRTSILERPGRS